MFQKQTTFVVNFVEVSGLTRLRYTMWESASRKWLGIEGFLQKCWKFHFAVSFLFLNRFLWFLMFFKVQNREFPFFASGYGIILLQWTKSQWLSAARSQIFWKLVFWNLHFLKFSIFEMLFFQKFCFRSCKCCVTETDQRQPRSWTSCASAGFRSCSETRSMTPHQLLERAIGSRGSAPRNCNL